MTEVDKYFTVPWAPGMEERQLDGAAWKYLSKKMAELRVTLALTKTDPQLLRWQVVMDLYARGQQSNAQAAMMLGLGMLDALEPLTALPAGWS